jgi:hypothetical protein
MPQWLTKTVVVLFYVGPTAWLFVLSLFVAWRIIKSDYVSLAWLNPFTIGERYVSEQLSGKTRAPDAIYQDEMIVARVRGEPQISDDEKTITFPRLVKTDNLEPGRTFLFRKWEAKLIQPAPGFTGMSIGGTYTIGGEGEDVSLPEVQSRTLTNAHARILGRAL